MTQEQVETYVKLEARRVLTAADRCEFHGEPKMLVSGPGPYVHIECLICRSAKIEWALKTRGIKPSTSEEDGIARHWRELEN